MNNRQKSEEKREIGMELKYCEHCGGLWLRECGAGVYCERCQRAIDELPTAKKRPGKVMLPVHPPTAIDGYAFGIVTEGPKCFKAAGGLL
jgi:hypothetical protein